MAAAASAVGDPTTGGGSWGAGDVCEASAPAGAGLEFGDSGRGTSVCIGPDGAASAIPSILSATGLRAWLRSACSNDTSLSERRIVKCGQTGAYPCRSGRAIASGR